MITIIPNTPCPQQLHSSIHQLVPLAGRVLDVGSGLAAYHPLVLERCRELTIVDAFEFYLKQAVEKYGFDGQIKPVLGTAQEVLPRFVEEEFDLALAIDFLEHLEKPESLAVVEQLKRVAPVVAVCVPRGNHPQDRDHLQNGADSWQTHRSRWEPGELEALGFKEEVWQGFHAWAYERYAHVPDFSPDAMWGVWRSWEAE